MDNRRLGHDTWGTPPWVRPAGVGLQGLPPRETRWHRGPRRLAPEVRPNGGQNEDGFYRIGSDVGTDVFVVTGGVTFGPFSSGTVIKYTQALGATPSSKTIGSTNGQAGAVTVHITGPDELVVRSSDGRTTTCFVPPPPK